MEKQNLLKHPSGIANTEISDVLAQFPTGRIEKTVSYGYTSPKNFWYDQTETEWVCVLEGSAELEFEDETVRLENGDCVVIPPRRRHRIKWTSSDPPCTWLCIFYE